MGTIKRKSALERKIFRLLTSPVLISDRLLTQETHKGLVQKSNKLPGRRKGEGAGGGCPGQE